MIRYELELNHFLVY